MLNATQFRKSCFGLDWEKVVHRPLFALTHTLIVDNLINEYLLLKIHFSIVLTEMGTIYNVP